MFHTYKNLKYHLENGPDILCPSRVRPYIGGVPDPGADADTVTSDAQPVPVANTMAAGAAATVIGATGDHHDVCPSAANVTRSLPGSFGHGGERAGDARRGHLLRCAQRQGQHTPGKEERFLVYCTYSFSKSKSMVGLI